MTLKQELEILLGEPVKPYEADPMDIPCAETSDPDKLCKHPVVSVHMVTYNHEPYIRQAIESVIMQKTSFEFELVIGEDCSQDKTREICLDYQKRYPDKIRVLWWHENVTKYGGNGRRVTAHCRGDFVAFCEGDDYWTDPLKLDKQIKLMKASGCVGCVAFNKILKMNGVFEDNVYAGKEFVESSDFFNHYFHTSTYLFSRHVFNKMMVKYHQIPYWYDTMWMHCMADMGKIALLPETVSVRRVTGKGVATSLTSQGYVILQLKQYIPLYLCGPRKYKDRFAMAILTAVSMFFYKHGEHYSKSLTVSYKRTMERIFYIVFRRYWLRCYAWGRLFRMIKYRWFA